MIENNKYLVTRQKAIQDTSEVFEYVGNDLKSHKKRLNDKLTKELLKCVLDNRENIREDTNGFIRWNCTTNKLSGLKGNQIKIQ